MFLTKTYYLLKRRNNFEQNFLNKKKLPNLEVFSNNYLMKDILLTKSSTCPKNTFRS